jgi:hypothetical protein
MAMVLAPPKSGVGIRLPIDSLIDEQQGVKRALQHEARRLCRAVAESDSDLRVTLTEVR